MTPPAYEYRAALIRVVDGDTIHADVDLGFDTHERMTLRLTGIDAPEIGKVIEVAGETRHPGIEASNWLVHALEGGTLTIRTLKDRREKYGRYLADLFVDRVDADGVVTRTWVNGAMVEAGHAVVYDGGKR